MLVLAERAGTHVHLERLDAEHVAVAILAPQFGHRPGQTLRSPALLRRTPRRNYPKVSAPALVSSSR
jgi:hypothetical protein